MAIVTASGRYGDNVQQTPATGPGTITPIVYNEALSYSFANGTPGAADQVDLTSAMTLTLSATPTVLNLFDSSSGTQVVDLLGNAISFHRIRRIFWQITNTTDGYTVKLGYATTTANAWTGLVTNPGQITLFPCSANNPTGGGGVFLAPNTTGMVVSTSSKLLNLDPGANTITLLLVIVGCSA